VAHLTTIAFLYQKVTLKITGLLAETCW